MTKFLLLDLLKFSLFSLKFLSHNSSLFKVIKSFLFLDFLVLLDLRSKLLRMIVEDFLLFRLNLLLSFSFFFLLLNNSQEFVPLLFSLFSEESFFLLELFFSCFSHFVEDFYFMFLFSFLFESLLSLTLLKSSLRSQSIYFWLSIRCSFLKFSQSLDLFFLLLSYSFLLLQMLLLSLCLQSVIINYFLLELFLFNSFLMFNINCLFVWNFNFRH